MAWTPWRAPNRSPSFEELGRQGMHVIISSHILDEVDRISDRVVLLTGGYLVAEGNIHGVRRKCATSPCRC